MSTHRDVYTYELIQERKKNGEGVYFDMYSKVICDKLRSAAANFELIEQLFAELHDLRDTIRDGTQHYYKDVSSYQRAISSMVRYAPTPALAQKYATLFFKEVFKPFRTSGVELTVLTNLVYVYGAEGSQESMEEGLNIIKLAIEIGVFKIDPEEYRDTFNRKMSFNNPLGVFETVSWKFLKYHSLAFSADKSELLPFRK